MINRILDLIVFILFCAISFQFLVSIMDRTDKSDKKPDKEYKIEATTKFGEHGNIYIVNINDSIDVLIYKNQQNSNLIQLK